jgi:hypothetical protein
MFEALSYVCTLHQECSADFPVGPASFQIEIYKIVLCLTLTLETNNSDLAASICGSWAHEFSKEIFGYIQATFKDKLLRWLTSGKS